MPKLNRIEALKVLDFIRTVCSKPEGEEFAVYQKGWDDKRIARKFNCDKATVERMRCELVGILRPARPKGSGAQKALPLANGVSRQEMEEWLMEKWLRPAQESFRALRARVYELERLVSKIDRATQTNMPLGSVMKELENTRQRVATLENGLGIHSIAPNGPA